MVGQNIYSRKRLWFSYKQSSWLFSNKYKWHYWWETGEVITVRATAQMSTHRIYLTTAPSAKKFQISFYPELTLDDKTSLSSSANSCPWFVSSTHVDPRVLHTNIWDHQVSCTEYLDSLHTDGTAILAEKKEREQLKRMGKNLYTTRKRRPGVLMYSMCSLCWGWRGLYCSKDQWALITGKED